MRSQIGNPKIVRPVNFRRFARELHSVAKQAPLSAVLESDFTRFGGGLGGMGDEFSNMLQMAVKMKSAQMETSAHESVVAVLYTLKFAQIA